MRTIASFDQARQDSAGGDAGEGRERSPGAFKRYLALLEGLAGAPPNASIREVARRAGLSPATAYRLLAELRDLGVLYEDPATGRYGLSLRLWSLVERFDRRDDLRTAALPVMQDLRDVTGETVTLIVAAGRERIVILEVASRHSAHFGATVGVPDRLDAGAPGKLLLGFLPPAAREAYLDRVAETDGPAAAAALRATADAIREQGYVVGVTERVRDFNVVSVPVRSASGSVAALTVIGPSSRYTMEIAQASVPAVLEAAAAIERALGARAV